MFTRTSEGPSGVRRGCDAEQGTIAEVIDLQVSTALPEALFEEVLPQLFATKVIVLADELRRPVGILTVIDALEALASAGGR